MNKYLILHYGFIRPTPEEMDAWNAWFDAIKERQVERGHLPQGRELTNSGAKDLPFGRGSLTGYTIIMADSLDQAEHIAAHCPIVDSTKVYQIQGEEEFN